MTTAATEAKRRCLHFVSVTRMRGSLLTATPETSGRRRDAPFAIANSTRCSVLPCLMLPFKST
ncbi:hypothetical protein [Burkholderia seminalis]|uniref:hypothetical protein n=1 Tax=Burkholderia seminalis TaxID=488731 RepID=UPI00158A3321|nr:hypothetical protein [Burkholderia seminalis]